MLLAFACFLPSAFATFSVGGSLALNGYGTFQSTAQFPDQRYSYQTGIASIEYVFRFPSGAEKTSGPITGRIGAQVFSTANGPWTETGSYTARVYLLNNPSAGVFSRVSVLDEYTWTIAEPLFTLTVNWISDPTNPGSGQTNGGGQYKGDTTPTVSAIPDPGSKFLRWQGDECDSATLPTTGVPMKNKDRSVTAVFGGADVLNSAPSIVWSSNPGTVAVNKPYEISAIAHDIDGNLVSVNITSDGTTFAVADGGNGADQTVKRDTSATSPGSVTYTATATDALGLTASITQTVTVKSPVTTSISANPTSITQGDSTTISWDSHDATSVSVSGPNLSSSAVSDNQTVSGLSVGTYTYTITAQGFNGPATQSVQVTVAAPPVSASISASPSSTMAPGSTTISWDTSNASSVSVTGPGFSTSSASSGSQTVSGLGAGSYTYTITAQGTNGPATDSTTVTVTAPIATTFSFSNTSFTYDGSAHAPTISPNPGPASYVTSGTRSATAVGAYAFTATANGNYTGSARCDWAITPKPVTFTIGGNLTPTYDGTSKPVLVSASDPNATFTTTYTGTSGTTYTASATAPTNAGTYTVSVAATGNYAGSASATLVVGKAAPVLTWASPAAITYGTALGSPQLDATATVPGTFSYTPAAGAILPSGAATLTANFTPADAANFTPAAAATTLAVNKATLTVTASSQARTYGTANPALTITCAGFVNGETIASLAAQPVATTTATVSSPVGTYSIVPAGGASPNYSFVYVNGTLTITKAIASVTLSNLSHVWSGLPQSAAAATVPAGLAVSLTYDGTASPPSAVGTYAVAATITDPNYTGSATGTLAITKATPAITWATPAAITYGTGLGAAQLNATASVPGTFTYTPSSGTVLAAGARVLGVTFTPTDSADYTSATASVTLQVNKATPTITWTTPAGITYGAALSTTELNASASAPGTFAYSPTAGTILPAGLQSLSVVFTPTDVANYNSAVGTVALMVAKRSLTVTAGNVTKIYGDANPTFSATYSGFTNGDTTAVISGTPVFNTTATVASGVGSYAITPALGTLTAANYSFGPFVAGILSVSKAALVVTANDQTKSYGAPNPPLTARYSGFVNGDTVTSLTGAAAITTTATPASSVGAYPITASAGTLASANYAFTFASGTLSITKAALTVTAANATKTYGDANPPFTAGFTGFVNGDTASSVTGAPTFTTTATASSAVGTYAITPALGSLASANYTFGSFLPGTLTITKAPLAVTANNKTRGYGQQNPTFDAAFAGFVNGDTVAVISGYAGFNTVATPASPAGNYAITPTPGSLAAANYSFGPFNNGTLTVTKASLTAIADSQSRTYGASNPPLTISYSGFVNGDSANVLTPPTASTTATASSGVGTYPITLTGGSAANYNLTLQNETLTVSKATLTVAPDDQTRVFGAANPPLTYRLIGFVNGDSASSLSGSPVLTTTASATSDVGSYVIASSTGTLSSANYQLSFANGTLTVMPKTVRFTFDDLTAQYDGAPKIATVSPSDPAATFTADLRKGPDAGSYQVSAVATGNYAGTDSATLTISPAPQTISLSPATLTVFAGQPATFTATGGNNAYQWAGAGGAVGQGGTATASFPAAGSYTVSVTNLASNNYLASNTATADVTVIAARQVASFQPLSSTYTISDPSSPMNGQTYGRIWQEDGWNAYLGRPGVRFEVKGQAWPAVKAVEIQAKAPGGTWTALASQDASAADTAIDAIFSVKLGDSAPGQPLVPLSYYEGAPQIGQWSFRARLQDTNSVWSEFSPEVPVNVVLPVSSKSVSGQTVAPAGELGKWFTASPVQTFTLQFWIP